MAEQIDAKTKREGNHGSIALMEIRPAHPFMAALRGRGFDDTLDLPQPLPSASPVLQSLPGAWAHGRRSSTSNEFLDSSEQGYKLSPQQADTEEPNVGDLSPEPNVGDLSPYNNNCDQESQNLAVASLVEAKSLPFAFPEAKSQDILVAPNTRQGKSRQWFAFILVSVVLVVCVILVCLFAVVGITQANDLSYPEDMSMPLSPSQGPTSVEEYILALIPEDSVGAINNGNSPQSQAFQWLLADDINLPIVSDLSEERLKQRFALATLYFATKGDGWVVNRNWLNYSVHECDWYVKPDFAERGSLSIVTPSFLAGFFPEPDPIPSACGKHGLLQHLWLDQNNLDGTIPEELYLLTNLKSLSLGANQLEGTISTLVGHLTSLEGLVIKGQKNAGQIPTEIGSLTRLRALILIQNDHNGLFPTELWHLTNLETIYLGKNLHLNGAIPTDIDRMSNLKMMLVHDTHFNGELCFCCI